MQLDQVNGHLIQGWTRWSAKLNSPFSMHLKYYID